MSIGWLMCTECPHESRCAAVRSCIADIGKAPRLPEALTAIAHRDGLDATTRAISGRAIRLYLTDLGAEALMRLAQKERRRCERMVEKNREAGWKPEPGHGDMNQIRLGNLKDIIDQLKAQLP